MVDVEDVELDVELNVDVNLRDVVKLNINVNLENAEELNAVEDNILTLILVLRYYIKLIIDD